MNHEKVCEGKHTFLLLVVYSFLNFAFEVTGLFLMKRASANLNSLTWAVLLPLTMIVFSFNFLGEYQENMQYYTWIGLLMTLFGVLWYEQGEAEEEEKASLPHFGVFPLILEEKAELNTR